MSRIQFDHQTRAWWRAGPQVPGPAFVMRDKVRDLMLRHPLLNRQCQFLLKPPLKYLFKSRSPEVYPEIYQRPEGLVSLLNLLIHPPSPATITIILALQRIDGVCEIIVV